MISFFSYRRHDLSPAQTGLPVFRDETNGIQTFQQYLDELAQPGPEASDKSVVEKQPASSSGSGL
jgi:hypothetical protein